MRIFGVSKEQGITKFKEYEKIVFADENREKDLETWILENPEFIRTEDDPILFIGRQVRLGQNRYIDILGIDKNGDIVVIELKRGASPRDTIAQALEYCSYASQLDERSLQEIWDQSSHGDPPETLLERCQQEFSNNMTTNENNCICFNNDQRIVIVAETISPEIRSTVDFLIKKGIRVKCIEFSFFKTNDGDILFSSEVLIDAEKLNKQEIVSSPLPRTTESKFMESVEPNAKLLFEELLRFAKQNQYPIYWGDQGFSLNVEKDGKHIVFCLGYPPPSYKKQSITFVFDGRGSAQQKLQLPDNIINNFSQKIMALNLFIPSGTGRNLKFIIDKDKHIDAQLVNSIVSIFQEYAEEIAGYPLKTV